MSATTAASTAALPQVLLDAQHVSQKFRLPSAGDFEALRDVSLVVKEREVVALVGPSGCGKSTLMRILAGLSRPTSGSVTYRGQPVDGVLSTAAMVFQSFALLPWLTVEQNVAMGLAVGHGDLKPSDRSAVARAVELVGLSGFEQAYPRELSGGMKQRVGFARALAVEPEILFMDEPFGALDALTAENLRSQVTELWQDPQTGVSTIIVVTHSVDEAVFLAGRVVVFGTNPGHIREVLENALPYPRDPRSAAFQAMVDRLHAILTATLLPEGDRPTAPGAPSRLAFPRVHVPEVLGLLDHLAARNQESGSVFDIAEQLAVDYDRMTSVVRAAEQLGWVETPGELVKLTPAGRNLVAADTADRTPIVRARVEEHPLFARVVMMLQEAEGRVLDDDEVLADLTIMLPFSKASMVLRTVIEWGRYAGILDHNARDKRLELVQAEGEGAETESPAGED